MTATREERADRLCAIHGEIVEDASNAEATKAGYLPLYTAAAESRLAVVGQAPGRRAQESGIPWDDASGVRLRGWLGVTEEQFYDPGLFALLPMDFYYPGKGKGGDLPPRKEFAPRWHPPILEQLEELRLTVLVGTYAQRHYLGARAAGSLTATVAAFRDYLPTIVPLVHPSPLNFRWQSRNPWFERDVIPVLRARVSDVLGEA
jgi:uracil-DNA glycosylase